MKGYKFDGTDPVMVFDFLKRLTEEADTINMTEPQAFLATPHYLESPASDSFRAAKHGSHTGEVTNWPSVVNYFLETYATPAAIRDATLANQYLKQKSGESELAFGERVTLAVYRCGTVYSETSKMSTYVKVLHVTTRAVVDRHRESTPERKLTFRNLIQFAKDEGEVVRAKKSNLKPIRSSRSSDLLLAEESNPPLTKRSVSFDLDKPDSTVTFGTPTAEEELNYIRHVPPAGLAFSDARTAVNRPGWINR